MIGVHLPIRIHLRDDIGAEHDCTVIAGHDRGSDSLVLFELHQIDPRITKVPDDLRGGIGAPVVDHHNMPDQPGNARDDTRDS